MTTGNFTSDRWNTLSSSDRPDWRTPRWLFDKIAADYAFTIDLAASAENALCPRFYADNDSAFNHSWANEIAWLNPPYGRELPTWCRFAHLASENDNAVVVALIPARVGTSWWHDYVAPHEVHFLRGRLHFDGVPNPAPFDSAIIVYGGRSSYTRYWNAKREAFESSPLA